MEPALGITASCAATFRPLFKGCGFGWKSSRQHSVGYQLREQRPRDVFKPVTDTQRAESGPGFDVPKDDGARYGSERELIAC